ncbi:MAG: 50S ribosomal protein L21 [Leptonema sp. (in: bacteria)]
MFAIIELKGKQHKIQKDIVFVSELTGKEPGSELEIETVLFINNGNNSKVGTPYVQGAKVKLLVLESFRGPKIRGFKYKRKTGYSKRWGHRQNLQKIKVLDIIL